MTTKQQKYVDGLKAKGLKKITLVIPARSEDNIREVAAKLRKAHLKKGETK